MRRRRKWYLIENSSQRLLTFNSARELKEWAKENGYATKRSPTDDRAFYTESHVYLPTGEKD